MSGNVLNTKRRVLHCDINSFFAILSQQKDPRLRGKPVGVVKEIGRTCIIAASKEAKKFGVGTGCMLSEAKRICPEIVTVPADFDYYWDESKKLHNMFREVVPKPEIFSLDEAFLDITDCSRIYPDAHELARLVQQKVYETLGEWVTCNVGIGWNRLLAKMAGETGPKGSVREVTEENLDEYLATTKFSDVCGVGMRLEKRLKEIGVDNLYAINLIDDETLEECVGPFWKSELRRMSGGGEPLFLTRIDRNSHMKSIGRSITGWGLTGSEDQIKRTLYNLTSEVCTKARKMSLVGRQMSIRLYGENKKFKNHVTLKNFTNHTNEVFEVIYHQLYKPHKRGFRVIKLGVRLGLLQPDNKLTIPLLPPWQRFENLYRAVDKINGKYTQHTIHSAAMHAPKMITEEITGFLGDKIYQFEYK